MIIAPLFGGLGRAGVGQGGGGRGSSLGSGALPNPHMLGLHEFMPLATRVGSKQALLICRFPSLCVPVFPCMLSSINTMNVDDTFYGPCHTQSNSTALPPRNKLPSSLALGWASHHLPWVQDQINSQIERSYWWRVGIWTQSGYTRASVQSSKNGKMKQR